jgi:hypothetical protein
MLARSILGFPALALLGSAGALAAEGASAVQDLRAAIALQGFPCDRVFVTDTATTGVYTASCKDGNRYHVFVDSAGRVVVKKL